MAEVFTIVLIIAAHCVNEIIRAIELLARATRAAPRNAAQRLSQLVRPTGRASTGGPTPS